MTLGAFGNIINPLNTLSGTSNRGLQQIGGLTNFLGNVIKFITVAAGIWALINIVLAGVTYISSGGDPKGIQAAQQKIYISLIGLIIIAASFALSALMGQILFGNPFIFINPSIYGA